MRPPILDPGRLAPRKPKVKAISLSRAILNLGDCRCGHAAINHWNSGTGDNPNIEGCSQRGCECKEFGKIINPR